MFLLLLFLISCSHTELIGCCFYFYDNFSFIIFQRCNDWVHAWIGQTRNENFWDVGTWSERSQLWRERSHHDQITDILLVQLSPSRKIISRTWEPFRPPYSHNIVTRPCWWTSSLKDWPPKRWNPTYPQFFCHQHWWHPWGNPPICRNGSKSLCKFRSNVKGKKKKKKAIWCKGACRETQRKMFDGKA